LLALGAGGGLCHNQPRGSGGLLGHKPVAGIKVEQASVDIDFSKIQTHSGSQQGGFEELVCQLAHLERPDDADYFFRKHGAGGDAGIECYWRMKDGSEHAWQAKYFLGRVKPSHWQQITDSIKSALDKHPNLTKYYICLPQDRTDVRRNGRRGSKGNTMRDSWNERVQQWKNLAASKEMDVEFEYWGKHEICMRLQKDDPNYSGRRLYWFGEPVFRKENFRRIAKKSRVSLGSRFTPELNLELPIAKHFDGIGKTPAWRKHLSSYAENLSSGTRYVHNEHLQNMEEWIILKDGIAQLKEMLFQNMKKQLFIERLKPLKELVSEVEARVSACSAPLWITEDGKDEHRSARLELHRISVPIRELSEFLSGSTIDAASSRAMLLYGEAGVGKSHLLCDVSMKRLGESLPTVFLLGQHYSGGNPLQFISDSLDMRNFSHGQILGALDAAGEAHNTNAMIIIDAINEGSHSKDWYNHLSRLLSEVSAYPNISLVLSCRDTYIDHLVPKDISEDWLIRVAHRGFRGFEHRAAARYLSEQGIPKPSAPILSPEFSNPLFLKTCAQAIKNRGILEFPKGLSGLLNIFDFYIESVAENINRRKEYISGESVVQDSIKEFSSILFPNYLSGVPMAQARKLFSKIDPNSHIGRPLLDELILEGVLSKDIDYARGENSRGNPIIRFSYERFSDILVARNLMEKNVINGDIRSTLTGQNPLASIFTDREFYNPYSMGGIVEALSLCIAEEFKTELADFVSDEFSFNRIFTNTLVHRSPKSITDRTTELLSRVQDWYRFSNPVLDILLSVSTEPEHPWNVDFLHGNLIRWKQPIRDSRWSVHVATSDYEEYEDDPETAIRSLINWALSAEIDSVDSERVRLCAMTLIWFTTTPNRKTRDQATKAAARILSHFPGHFTGILDRFHKVDDLYLLERLYAIGFGVVTNAKNPEIVREISARVYRYVFDMEMPIPHILLRDYARETLEFAKFNNLLPVGISPETFRPPYKSEWPLDNPSGEEIESLDGGSYIGMIKASVTRGLMDFGRYTMGDVRRWSPTPLSEENPEMERRIHGGSSYAEFDQEWAQRWVCKRAIELGQGTDFSAFDERCSEVRFRTNQNHVERMGKKYQWIAYHEFLAHLSDNVHFIGGRVDDGRIRKYSGPWQVAIRDIDPSMWLRKSRELREGQAAWWQPHKFQFAGSDIEQQKEWVHSRSDIPNFHEILELKDPKLPHKSWIALRGDDSQDKKPVSNGDNNLTQTGWFRINSIIVEEDNYDEFIDLAKSADLQHPDIVHGSDLRYIFIREYPWHEILTNMTTWINPENEFNSRWISRYHNPALRYMWECGHSDFSEIEGISIYLPSKFLIDNLKLSHSKEQVGVWLNEDGELVYLDPSVDLGANSYGLIDMPLLVSLLKKMNLRLIFLIGGEKIIMDLEGAPGQYYNILYHAIYSMKDEKIEEIQIRAKKGSHDHDIEYEWKFLTQNTQEKDS